MSQSNFYLDQKAKSKKKSSTKIWRKLGNVTLYEIIGIILKNSRRIVKNSYNASKSAVININLSSMCR